MKDKNEEDISGLLLWGATVLYITVLCMAFAGLVALDGHGRSVVIIFTEFVKDYGSLLAGIPVLIAVLVAKQQLDANRREHVANIRLQFRDELLGLQTAEDRAKMYRYGRLISHQLVTTLQISPAEIDAVGKCNCLNVIKAFTTLQSIINDGERYPVSHKMPKSVLLATLGLPDRSGDETIAANDVLRAVNERKSFLRQFMPEL